MIRKRTQARECALQILYQDEVNPRDIKQAITLFWESQPDMTSEVREFAETLVLGAKKNSDEIDQVIQTATQNWQIDRMAVIDRNILRFAVYELLYMEDIPPKVTINEAVNIAKKFSQEDSGKFVNGVLDKINHTEKPHFPPSEKKS